MKALFNYYIAEAGIKEHLFMNTKLYLFTMLNNKLPSILNARDTFLFLKYFFIPVLIVFLMSIVMVILFRRYRLDRIDSKTFQYIYCPDNEEFEEIGIRQFLMNMK